MRRPIILLSTFVSLIFSFASLAQPYRYQDEAGNFFFVDRLSQVPEKYRTQIIKPKPLVFSSEKERRQYYKQQQRIQAMEARAAQEAGSAPMQLKNHRAKIQGGAVEHDDLKQIKSVDLFVSPSCSDCTGLEKFLKANGIKYRKLDIVKNQQAFELFDKLGAGSKVPVTRIGNKIIKGNQPTAILEAATKLHLNKEKIEVGSL